MSQSTATFVNFYELLNLPPNASQDSIEQKIKEEIRTWRKRTSSPDLSKRQEAELRMQHLNAAREILLDPGARAQHDRQAAAHQSTGPRSSTPPTGRNWVEQAEEYLAKNDYHSAAYAAREATQVEGNSPVAWNLRGRANAGLGRFDDAVYEVRQAAELDPNNAQYHFDLGAVHEQMENWSNALGSYERASALDPRAILYRVSVAGVYLQNNVQDKALPILEELYRAHPADQMVNFYLAACLHDMAENTPARKGNGQYVITSAAEIERMESLVGRARSLKHGDPDLTESLDGITAYIQKCRATTFSPPPAVANAGLLAIGFCLLLPVFGVLMSLGSLGPSRGASLLWLLVFAGIGFLVFRSFWVPGWKKNLRSFR